MKHFRSHTCNQETGEIYKETNKGSDISKEAHTKVF